MFRLAWAEVAVLCPEGLLSETDGTMRPLAGGGEWLTQAIPSAIVPQQQPRLTEVLLYCKIHGYMSGGPLEMGSFKRVYDTLGGGGIISF